MNEKELLDDLKEKVHKFAATNGQQFNSVWKQLVLERFLAKVSRSKYSEHLVFKGGMLLSKYLPLGRETIDLDFLLHKIGAEKEKVKGIIEDIISQEVESGFKFELIKISEIDHQSTNYLGLKASLVAKLDKTKTSFHVDIGVGDTVNPNKTHIEFIKNNQVAIFEDGVQLFVYPPEAIFAEKYETVVSRRSRNTRMKDFYDLWMLIKFKKVDPELSLRSIENTCATRETDPIGEIKFSSKELQKKKNDWTNFISKRLYKEDDENRSFEKILSEINQFLKVLKLE
ncbi:MAG: nucleotidyl transferase AbiEii/AbiGii toxin family protein [Candidatus Brocadiales bacterium]|nr:nucleotidyl transferase AbiEii/AbiGii toxin family protein [Candidatus Brocadiales bacterium]